MVVPLLRYSVRAGTHNTKHHVTRQQQALIVQVSGTSSQWLQTAQRTPYPLTGLTVDRSSSSLTRTDTSGKTDGSLEVPSKKQPFVQATILPAEWDDDFKDPLYAPKFRSRAKVISQEDFDNRPKVGFSSQFASMEDAMAVESHIDRHECEAIYQLYVGLIEHSYKKHGITSHEYVVRVIAQKYNISFGRASGIITLQHNEAQIAAAGGPVYTELGIYMDQLFKEDIQECYKANKMEAPEEFIEEPQKLNRPSRMFTIVDDVYNVEQMLRDLHIRDQDRARSIIDNHVYVEDVDDITIPIPNDKHCNKLMRKRERLSQEFEQELKKALSKIPKSKKPKSAEALDPATFSPADIPYRTMNGHGKKRPRWKYVAQTVNVRELKKKRSKHRSYTNNSPMNTIVEQNDAVRTATMEDMRYCSWKPLRSEKEHGFFFPKQGWLDRMLRGKTDTWGVRTSAIGDGSPNGDAKAADTTETAVAEDNEGEDLDEESVDDETIEEDDVIDEDDSIEELDGDVDDDDDDGKKR